MHEYALAEGVISTALKVAADGGVRKITRIVVAIGELQQIERELFAQALIEVMPATHEQLADAAIDLRVEPALLRCRVCDRQFGMAEVDGELAGDEAEAVHFIPELAHTYLRCPGCGSPDFAVLSGRGVWLETVEGNT